MARRTPRVVTVEEPEPQASDEPEVENTESTAERLVRELREKFAGERITQQYEEGVINPIELAKLMGVRPQMVYQDIRSGKLTATTQNNTQKIVVERATAIEYAASYLDRRAARQLQKEQEAAAAQAS